MADDRSDKVEVKGLRELQKALRDADPALARELRRLQKDLAEEIVSKAQARAESDGGVEAKSAPALKAAAEQRAAKVILDGDRFPFALGAEFGAKRFPQFKPWRGNQYTDPLGQDVGYFLHPTLRAERNRIVDAYDRMIADLVEQVAKS